MRFDVDTLLLRLTRARPSASASGQIDLVPDSSGLGGETQGEPTKFQHYDDDVVERTTRRRQSCQQRNAAQLTSGIPDLN